MIDDSYTWKVDLERAALELDRKRKQRRWTDASVTKTEKLLINGAFAVRKLIESNKISDEVEASTIATKVFPLKASHVDRFNRTDIDELYDLKTGTSDSRTLTAFANQFIHSFVLSLTFTRNGGLRGVFVASDRERVRRCLFFTAAAIADMFRRVAYDDIVWFESKRASDRDEMIIVRKSNRIPRESLHLFTA